MSFYVTVAGKFVNEKRLDIISNNLANALTSGYKAVRPVFNMVSSADALTGNSELLKNAYVGIYDTFIDFSDGAILDSGSAFDMAIIGNGFFVVQSENGNVYTRNGQFTLDRNGRLVTMNGDPVMGKGGEINIDMSGGENLLIENDGSIYVGNNLIDTVRIVDFNDKRGLRPIGKNYFINENEAEQEITPDLYSVRQGSYEASNINVVREMVDLIQTMRAYECYTKVDQMFGDINKKVTELGKF